MLLLISYVVYVWLRKWLIPVYLPNFTFSDTKIAFFLKLWIGWANNLMTGCLYLTFIWKSLKVGLP
jgi:hypothetical protein